MARAATPIFYTARSVRRQTTISSIDKSRKTFLTGMTLALILLISSSIFYIGIHVKAVNLGYKINQEIQRKEKLTEENKRHRLEIATLKSPTRIEQEALGRLGFSLPKSTQVIYLSKLETTDLPKETIAAKPALPQSDKIKTENKVQVAEKKIQVAKKNPVEKKKATEKKSAEVILATLVRERPLKISDSSKVSSPKFAQVKTRERVPAVMIDPMP